MKSWIAGLLLVLSLPAFASSAKEEVVTDYIDLDRITVNIPGTSKAKHLIVNVQIELDRPDPNLKDEEKEKKQTSIDHTRHVIQDYLPVLKHEFIFLFRGQTFDQLNSSIGVEQLREQSTRIVKELVDKKGGHAEDVLHVLFPNFVMQ